MSDPSASLHDDGPGRAAVLTRIRRDRIVSGLVSCAATLAGSPVDPDVLAAGRRLMDQWWDELAELDHGPNGPDRTHPAVPDTAAELETDTLPPIEPVQTGAVVDPAPAGPAASEPLAALRAEADAAVTAAKGLGVLSERRMLDDATTLWRDLHLVVLRLPAAKARDVRIQAATAVGIDAGDPERYDRVVVPAFDGTAEIDLEETKTGLVAEKRAFVREYAGEEAWLHHQPLMAALADVLVMLTLDGTNLRIMFAEVNGIPTMPANESNSGDFVTSVQNALHSHASAKNPVDRAARLRTLLAAVLGIAPNPIPHPESWWAANAGAAIAHVRDHLRDQGHVYKDLPSRWSRSELVDWERSYQIHRPPTMAKGALLWTLTPWVELTKGPTLKGTGVYAND